MRAPTPDLTPGERRILADIEEHGVHMVHVAEREDSPGWSYTIGLWHHFEQPEVIVFGLDDEVAQALLDLVTDEVAAGPDAACRFLAGSEHRDLLAGYPVRVLEVPPVLHGSYLGQALWAYDGEPFAAVQLVWPDKQGRWPWSDGVREGFRRLQPLLDRLPPTGGSTGTVAAP